MTRRPKLLAALAVGAVLLTGCSFKGAYSLPLPGGAAHGKTYHVTASFADVQDLVVQSAVRVDDVAVGDVTSINLDLNPKDPDYLKAQVGMRINSDVKLPANSVATLQQTTLLGEKFIALAPPTNVAPVGRLANNAVLNKPGSTADLPSVEEVFGLLSQVLNGSDLADLQTINVEVSKALAGRETQVRGALTQLDTFVTGLAKQKSQIVRALEQLDRFSSALATQNSTIATALTDLGPGLKVLANERSQFTSLLTDLSTFGKVATHVIDSSREQTITGLHDLQPILAHLAAAGADLPHSLEILVTFPFPRDSSQASPGDYTNFAASLDIGPIICAALANFNLTSLTKLLTADGSTITQLTGISVSKLLLDGGCPAAGSVTSPNATTPGVTGSTPPASGSGSGSTPSSPAPPTTGSSPSPSPSSSGLAGLLNGLIGGSS